MDKRKREQVFRFYESWRRINVNYDAYSRKLGLTWVGLCILEMIQNNPQGVNQKGISEHLGVAKQTVNLTVRNFWEKGWINLDEIPTDRRNKSITLTPKGQQATEDIMGKVDAFDREAFSAIPHEQMDAAIAAMESYERALIDSLKTIDKSSKKNK